MFAEIELKDLASDCPGCHGEGMVSRQNGAAGGDDDDNEQRALPGVQGG